MKVIWMPQAKQQMRQTAIYIRDAFGPRIRDKFVADVREANSLLGCNPNTGKIEPLLSDIPGMYRSYVLNHLNKIVYHLCNDHIEVVAFWDVRREPAVLVDEMMKETDK